MKSIIYYTDNRLDKQIFHLVQAHLLSVGLPIVSASLKPMKFGDNEVISGDRGYATMVNQIVSCLKRAKTKYVFFCEHDVLYHPSHFKFNPESDDIFYYDANMWRWEIGSNKAIRHDRMIPLSMMCANREFALNHYLLRQKMIIKNGWDKDQSGEPKWARIMGYEPGTKTKKRGGITDDDFGVWLSKLPSIDIRHKQNFSSPKTKIKDFKHKPKWWQEISIKNIPSWDLKGIFK